MAVDEGPGTRTAAPTGMPREIWVLVGAAFVIAIGFGLVAPALPAFARSFDVGVTAASFVISLFAVFRLGFAPVSGRLVGRFGELRVYVVGLCISTLSTGACAFAANYWQLLFFRAFGGIGSTMFTVSAISLLVRLAPPAARGRASGMWATGFLLGNIAGPLVGGVLITISLRAPFYVYTVALVVALVLSGLMLRGRTGGSPASDPDAAPAATFRVAWKHPTFRAALAASFANGWTVFGVRVALVPLFVVEILHQREDWAGYALAVFAVGNAAALMVSGRLADRHGRRPPVMAGLVVTALGTGVLGLIGSLPLFLAVSLVCGAGSGLVNPPMTAAVADVIGSKARGGTVLAGFQMAADVGAILGPVLAGAVAETSGFAAAFVLTGAVSALALLFWLRAPETLPGRSSAAVDASAAAAVSDGLTVPGSRGRDTDPSS
ncbi:MFS transporter [Pseudonocardia asaccharolytica]|uniref:Putative transporter n=1 Tax=Pseudonocardia asaccharolytica DSM 44247 = NBRC 16224 TaxID=1123024 RepID=A0A511D1G0_9PSEU|nr:MFS transporter [Pseudonocardia asaccharolytica]GEL18626.1 putative transporter [Pseudonocardia asaccharolytica DSM 44247 = NBRC 16224]